ncbi:5-bromo-4-chloroindolyl phosphate hydrolysis family protein [Lapidilactobacillus mulanensis]|uniref:5-bromo-4-chloroindolyl phosphate hydrolysis family protein n=1 Tax=Lapidilactobacillus mulanensis TaxID=2485999 RepID=A0ABW4DKP3_9LACO|nr:5-bromo-4-chloroindolyl phosphate hydrolysis family protein [Lapidilactobacillus mulanensis]
MNKKSNIRRILYLIAIIVAGFILFDGINAGPRGFFGRLASLALLAVSTALIIRSIQHQSDKNLFRKFSAWTFYSLAGCTGLGTLLSMSDNVDGDVFNLAICTFFFSFIAFLFVGMKSNQKPVTETFETPVSNKMLNHYHQTGLSDTDINVFRDTMSDAKKQIVELETTMTAVPKLRAINLNHDTLEVAKAMFAALVKEPQRLQEAADFLYKHLPNSVQIAKKYQEINTHEVKTADTYAVLDRSVEVLATLSEQMKHDYTDFVAEDISDLSSTLDSVNKPAQHADFNIKNEQSVSQMQDQLSQIQKDYLANQTKTDQEKDGDDTNE